MPLFERAALRVVVLADDAAADGSRLDRLVKDAPALGQTLAIETSGATCSTTYPLHAKLVVDSIGAAAVGRPIYVRVRVNPNCGFRSLEPGLPKS